jgi:hypothetical protein
MGGLRARRGYGERGRQGEACAALCGGVEARQASTLPREVVASVGRAHPPVVRVQGGVRDRALRPRSFACIENARPVLVG